MAAQPAAFDTNLISVDLLGFHEDVHADCATRLMPGDYGRARSRHLLRILRKVAGGHDDVADAGACVAILGGQRAV